MYFTTTIFDNSEKRLMTLKFLNSYIFTSICRVQTPYPQSFDDDERMLFLKNCNKKINKINKFHTLEGEFALIATILIRLEQFYC